MPCARRRSSPLRAEIDGSGVGAVRRCIFTTGTFVEPIEAWEPPHRLRFEVTGQPDPRVEWSPWLIHPTHLDGHLESQRGQFLLDPAGEGRTRLEGATWYVQRMWPEAYGGASTDFVIHRSQRRVLDHIAALSVAAAR